MGKMGINKLRLLHSVPWFTLAFCPALIHKVAALHSAMVDRNITIISYDERGYKGYICVLFVLNSFRDNQLRPMRLRRVGFAPSLY